MPMMKVGILLATLVSAAPAPVGDRLDPQRMEALVSGPIGAVRSGRIAEGEGQFEDLLKGSAARNEAAGVETADMLESFGVLLYTEGLTSSQYDLRRRSLPYLARAVTAYRGVFGAGDLETALALASYADVERALAPNDPPPDVETAYAEVSRIRMARLGPRDPQTLAAQVSLDEVRALPSRTRGDVTAIESVAGSFKHVIDTLRARNDAPAADVSIRAYKSLAILYLSAQRTAAALQTFTEMEFRYRIARGNPNCVFLLFADGDFRNALEKAHLHQEAERVGRQYLQFEGLPCIGHQ